MKDPTLKSFPIRTIVTATDPIRLVSVYQLPLFRSRLTVGRDPRTKWHLQKSTICSP